MSNICVCARFRPLSSEEKRIGDGSVCIRCIDVETFVFKGGNARTALLCCHSPSSLNASETLSTLQFGAGAQHVKTSQHVNCNEEKCIKGYCASRPLADESCARILSKLRERMNADDVKLLEELFVLVGIIFDPGSVDELESEFEDLTLQTISSMQATLEKLISTVDELKRETSILKGGLNATTKFDGCKEVKNSVCTSMISGILAFSFLGLSIWLVHATLSSC